MKFRVEWDHHVCRLSHSSAYSSCVCVVRLGECANNVINIINLIMLLIMLLAVCKLIVIWNAKWFVYYCDRMETIENASNFYL